MYVRCGVCVHVSECVCMRCGVCACEVWCVCVCACEVWCVCVYLRRGVQLYESASVCPWPTTGLPC